MAGPGQIPGRYNLVVRGKYDTFDHQLPVEEFLTRLRENDVPQRVCVVGLGRAFEDGDLAQELARETNRRANDLETQNPLPTIQFAVEGSFHRSGKTYDLRYGDALYPLQDVFGPQMDRKEDGNWLVVPF
jgi:hypothetical protein